MKVDLLPHNQEAYEKICQMYDEGIQRVAVVQPTGSGKSFLMAKLIEDNSESRFFVLSTSHKINDQFKEKLDDEMLKRINFNIYCNMPNMKKEDMEVLQPDYILLDEMHRALAKEWSKGIKVLLEMYPDAKVLGLSATPIRYLDRCRNVVKELFNGNLACDMSLSQAILDGILPMARYVCGVYSYQKDDESLNKKIEKSYNSEEEKKELLKQVKVLKENLDKGNGVSDIFKKYIVSGNEKFVVFLKDIKHLRRMRPVIKKWFTDVGFSSVRIYEVHSKNADRDKEFQAFKEDTEDGIIKLCLSVAMLSEGLHGDISGVIMLRETMSPNLYFQMIGRAFSCGKKTIPLIFDLVANSQFISDSVDNFPNELRGEIEKRKEDCEKEGREYEVGFNVDEFIVMDQFMDVVSGFRAIEERLEGSWDLYIKALGQYKEREGNCNVPERHIEIVDDVRVSLGRWVSNIRNTKSGKGRALLTTERIKQLDEIEFIWDGKKYQFINNVNDCIRFYEKNNRKPCKESKDNMEKRLGIFWNYYRNKKGLSKWEKDILEQIPLFFAREELSSFEKFCNYALIYKKRYGNFNFKKCNTIDGYNIYQQYYKLRYEKDKLTIDQVKKLEHIGINLSADKIKENYNNKMELAKQAVAEGIILNNQNKSYKGVNFYNFKNTHWTDFSTEERKIINKLLPNQGCEKPVKIIDVKSGEIYTYQSICDAGRALHNKFHIVEKDKSGEIIIGKRLRGETKNPIYKNRFCFEYGDKKEVLENM